MKKKILEACLRIARTHLPNHSEYQSGFMHYTFVIQNKKIIKWATNNGVKCDLAPKLGYPKHSKIHSEPAAWKKAKGLVNRRRPFQIINIRLNRKGQMRNSKPCWYCACFLDSLNCNEVWYTTNLGFRRS
jgi:hypothetical protein